MISKPAKRSVKEQRAAAEEQHRLDVAKAKTLVQNHGNQPCVKSPTHPITGERAVISHGPYGPHFGRKRFLLFGARQMWWEKPIDIEILVGTPHAMILPSHTTMWGYVEC